MNGAAVTILSLTAKANYFLQIYSTSSKQGLIWWETTPTLHYEDCGPRQSSPATVYYYLFLNGDIMTYLLLEYILPLSVL